jgi:uncharacterized protein
MTEPTKDIIRHRVHRAEDTLAEALYLLQGGYVETAVSRCYYACFYAVSAPLLTKELSSKTHKGMRILFGQHIVNTGIMTTSMSKLYSEVFAFRQEGDYEDFPDISAETAQELLTHVREFVKEASELTMKAIE